MSDQSSNGRGTGNSGNSSFSHAFLPGLILGLIIGAVAGAYLPDMMNRPAIKNVEIDPDAERLPRNERPIEQAGEGLEELGEQAEEAADDTVDAAEDLVDDESSEQGSEDDASDG